MLRNFYHTFSQRASICLLLKRHVDYGKVNLHRHFCNVLPSRTSVMSQLKSVSNPDFVISNLLVQSKTNCLPGNFPRHSFMQTLSYSSSYHGEVLERTSKTLLTEPARQGSTSGMSGSRTPSLGHAFSDENKERVMSSLSSKRTLRRFYTKDVKQRGAVVVPLCSINREPCILFTLRTRTLKDHSGEVSFPGGKMDPTDGDVCHTALRELQEELGVDPATVEVWGNLSPVGREKITVVPVIGYLGEIDIQSLKYNPDEVSSVFVMTLSHLCSPASQAYTIFEPHAYSGQPMATLPVFVGGEHRVWGLTAHILDLALQAIVPDHYRSLVTQVKKEQTSSS